MGQNLAVTLQTDSSSEAAGVGSLSYTWMQSVPHANNALGTIKGKKDGVGMG